VILPVGGRLDHLVEPCGDRPSGKIRESSDDRNPDSGGTTLTGLGNDLRSGSRDSDVACGSSEDRSLQEENTMSYDVAVKTVPSQHVASWTARTSLTEIGQVIGGGFGILRREVAAAGTQPTGAPFIIYYDLIDEHTEGRLEICVPVPAGTRNGPQGEVSWREISGSTVAWTTHHGPYEQIAPAYDTITRWISEQGHRIAGPPREIYLNDPQTVPAAELRTEVQFPIEE
jgi:effector-binding domain-containing protein